MVRTGVVRVPAPRRCESAVTPQAVRRVKPPIRRSDRRVVQSVVPSIPEPEARALACRVSRSNLIPASSGKSPWGAVGSRRVAQDLDRLGHQIAELERGAMDTKLWKEVKRKRVRIPDLVCRHCGLRIESRAKTKTELSMSHSPTDQERAWDSGMVDADVIAFPVCKAGEEKQWSAGRLSEPISYWHERNWIRWQAAGKVNYVRVARFRAVPPGSAATKGVTEGSETSVAWKTRFSSRDGVVEALEGQRITIARAADGQRHTQTIPPALRIVVAQGEEVSLNQIIASGVRPESDHDLRCTGALLEGHLPQLLASRERTQRFTGVKLARLRGDDSLGSPIASLESDQEEDVYIRLEAAAYLVAVRNLRAEGLFGPYLASPDQQIQLEAVIALGEAGTGECVRLLSDPPATPSRRPSARRTAGRSRRTSCRFPIRKATPPICDCARCWVETATRRDFPARCHGSSSSSSPTPETSSWISSLARTPPVMLRSNSVASGSAWSWTTSMPSCRRCASWAGGAMTTCAG